MGDLTNKVNEKVLNVKEIHTVKVVEHIQDVVVPRIVEKEVTVEKPIYKEVRVERPKFEDVVVRVQKVDVEDLTEEVEKIIEEKVGEALEKFLSRLKLVVSGKGEFNLEVKE